MTRDFTIEILALPACNQVPHRGLRWKCAFLGQGLAEPKKSDPRAPSKATTTEMGAAFLACYRP